MEIYRLMLNLGDGKVENTLEGSVSERKLKLSWNLREKLKLSKVQMQVKNEKWNSQLYS